jgi:hypothetical protein
MTLVHNGNVRVFVTVIGSSDNDILTDDGIFFDKDAAMIGGDHG